MLPHLKPAEEAIEKLALAETDPRQQPRFAPLRWGFLGNLAIILFAGAAGLLHALVAAGWHRVFHPPRHGAG
jgi:hypothetical protein